MDDDNKRIDIQLAFSDRQPPRTSKRWVTYWIASLIMNGMDNYSDLFN